MKKNLIITIDTEGDNLWKWHEGDDITTNNAKYIMRFQNLCEKYHFIPTYLVNYEMAKSDLFVSLFKQKAKDLKCEIGMHLHAWNTPPYYPLENKYKNPSFIIEYPKNIIYQKHQFLKEYLEQRFEVPITSYRSGRWATNDDLFDVLEELNILVDCSITPKISHKKNKGYSIIGANTYSHEKNKPRKIRKNLIEIPMTTLKLRNIRGINLKNRLSHLIKGEEMWFRTATSSFETLKLILKKNKKNDYIEFMIHSSELMPKGSPYFITEEDIERHYELLEKLFKLMQNDYQGISISDYAKKIKEKL